MDCFGVRDSYGSWKIICIFCLRSFILSFGSLVTSTQPPDRHSSASFFVINFLETAFSMASLTCCVVRPSPPYWTDPPVGSTSTRMALPVVVLPQPDSPTRQNISLSLMLKDTPSTALTHLCSFDTRLCTKPVLIGNQTCKSLTTRISLTILDHPFIGGTKWHAAQCPGLTSTRGGPSLRHISLAMKHLSANLHPIGALIRFGGGAAMAAGRVSSPWE